jgi:hypothetical protein
MRGRARALAAVAVVAACGAVFVYMQLWNYIV